MTKSFDEAAYLQRRAANEAKLTEAGVYGPQMEHDACGVGFVAARDGKPNRAVVESAIEALQAIWHRGAVDADGMTGDGAGIHIEIPRDFFIEHIARTGHDDDGGRLAVGMVFLPRTDLAAQERCRCIVEQEILAVGHSIYGWRQVPVDIRALGTKAIATRPEIEQIMFSMPVEMDATEAERQLYLVRRRIEKAVIKHMINDFYLCSLSSRSIIYKGMFLAEQVTAFFPDLLDQRFVSSFAIYHQRYSTNTMPTWKLAQPFRVLAHNGEINTIRGNQNWMSCHEDRMESALFGDAIGDLKPVVANGSSDSAALDAVFELLVHGGRQLPMVKTMMIPEAIDVGSDHPRAKLYAYCNSVMEPWDGPAAIAAFAGDWVVAGLDRNGLRPLRYVVTHDGLVIAGSETGMVVVPDTKIAERGRLGPGQMIGINLAEGRLYKDGELKDALTKKCDWSKWIGRAKQMDSLLANSTGKASQPLSKTETRRRQMMGGWTMEDMELVLQPMAQTGKEAIGSMGDDTPLAVLSNRYRGLHHFFRQNFSQVTNPPIDSLRERHVMTLRTRLGNLGNILDEAPEQCDHLVLNSPVLTVPEWDALCRYVGKKAAEIDCSFENDGSDTAFTDALERIQAEAEEAVRSGCEHVMLTDRNVSESRIPMPMILATGAVHSHLVRQQLRTFTSVNVASGECLDVHHFAVLIGVGATTVNAYVAEAAIAERHERGLLVGMELRDAVGNFVKAVEEGLLKIMSKMGISVIASYRGGYNFEALGLSRSLVADYFPPMSSRISGLGLKGIATRVIEMHNKAFANDDVHLPVGGFFRYRKSGERHAFDGQLIHAMQHACDTGSFESWKKYSSLVTDQGPINLRDLMAFKAAGEAVEIDRVESITNIRKRLVSPGISLGALSPEAHETLSIAMNRIGAKSDSGEGGEDPARFKLRENGDNPSSAIKQIASGRFGVTAEYLNNCEEIEIKVAQGAKPGEGGQLPGIKVDSLIARLRHSTPGVTLISPPPHHDIYSIEDLAQLIYDLKQINPEAKVCVKLVASTGIGTIAAGVAKAKADSILVSGHGGGTGASPQSSIKYAGLPWEMGLSEVHQVLSMNDLRNKVVLRTDGGLKTGRDVVMAAMLGADEYGIGTSSLIAMGCIMVRQCHSNTCPVGVCTQRDDLRAKFEGTPEKVVQLFTHLAEEVREILASLGFTTLQQVIGRTDLLTQVSRGDAALDDLDLNPILVRADSEDELVSSRGGARTEVPDTLDAQMVVDAKLALENGSKMQLSYNVENTQRAIGTRLSSHIVRRFGMTGLREGHILVRLRGSAGQSLGAFATQGLRLDVIGDANDYVGKGLSGGMIVVRPSAAVGFVASANTIIGNTVLYGATSGKLFAAGQAGERLCVRNSGATAVVEGSGSNACEYMTGGNVVILGEVGDNFGAGMTGGMAFIYDEAGNFESRVNRESLQLFRIAHPHWENKLRDLVAEHARETESALAARILNHWDQALQNFWQVVPTEIIPVLDVPLKLEEDLSETA
ncbi:glutamate synthase large subunit [Alphaproteobacteria bacterium]|jgi:glutamate synthase (NADPH/NADH) large chain|nr:glutamate synthase large subunit [Alphaproteobacteria bacterium]MDB0014074.1 glutamate synthase large subunit [Alphaproteobacteria bacterium]